MLELNNEKGNFSIFLIEKRKEILRQAAEENPLESLIQKYEQLIKFFTEQEELKFKQIISHIEKQSFVAAIATAKKFLDQYPHNYLALYFIGKLQTLCGQIEWARQSFSSAYTRLNTIYPYSHGIGCPTLNAFKQELATLCGLADVDLRASSPTEPSRGPYYFG